MDTLSRLEEIGFEKAGCWNLDSGTPSITLDSHASQTDVLYAFVCAREVLYVGNLLLQEPQ